MLWQPIRALRDNYIWAGQGDSSEIVVVDPGESRPILHYLSANNLTLSAILITHHHHDHTGGVYDLIAEQNIPVYGPKDSPFSGITHPLSEGDCVALPFLDASFVVWSIPAHTIDHIAYVGDRVVFTGDTLFSGGCGRVFEGNMQQMLDALNRFAALPDNTEVYCGHEYTLNNLGFARTVLPDDPALVEQQRILTDRFKQTETTLPTTIANERMINVFFRLSDKHLLSALSARMNRPVEDALDAFTILREWKDQY